MRFFRSLCVLVLLIQSSVLTAAEVITSAQDQRSYRVIQLDNQLKVALISDARLSRSAAALSVQAGSNANPEDREGLAHFLEHMLFLGTEKYPEAGEYQSFISANGGSHNAFTAYDNTTYFFDIKADAFEGALDRFAQFFISPLFNPEYVERERNAVHSEFESKKMDDGRRIYVADKLAMNAEHPWSMFSVGNLQTLDNSPDNPLRPELIAFYQRYYSANLMTAALIGPESLEQLELLAQKYFGDIENRDVPPYLSETELYDTKKLPLKLEVKTLKAMQQLRISFPLPERRSLWRQKPLYYIANQLGYEGAGSLLSYLKQMGWAEALGAWVGIDLQNQSRFDISIDLTQEGEAQINAVVDAVFAELRLIQKAGIQAQLFEEQRQLSETDFRFQQPGEPSHEVVRLAQSLTLYPDEELLRAPYLFSDFAPEKISEYLSLMTPDRMILSYYSDHAATDSHEPIYGIEFSIKPIDRNLIERWRAPQVIEELSIRSSNPFIAQRFDIKTGDQPAETPTAVVQSERFKLWHLQDQTFAQPRGAINLALFTPYTQQSAQTAVATTLLTRMLSEMQNELLYDASLAGLSTELYPHLRGISLKVSGYDDRLAELFAARLKGLNLPLNDHKLFERVKRSYHEELLNNLKDKPYNRTFSELYHQMLPGWSTEERVAALASVQLETLIETRRQLFASGELKMFVHGNFTADEAVAMSQSVESQFASMQAREATPLPVKQILSEAHVSLAVEHSDHALLLYLQGSDKSVSQQTEVALINELLAAAFYTSLRTEQQLGYIVFSNYLPMDRQPGIALVVQSPVADKTELENAFEQFLQSWQAELPALLNRELAIYKQSLAARISTPAQRLNEETARLWREIDRDNTAFDTREQMLAALDKIEASDILERFDQIMQRKLWISSDH